MVLNGSAVLHDVTIRLKELLASGVIDPLSGSRASGQSFVMSSYPDRPVSFPYITAKCSLGAPERLGMSSQAMKVPVKAEIRTWSKTVSQRDALADAAFYTLQQNQTNSSSGLEAFGLYDFGVVNQGDVDEPGKDGVHSKVTNVQWFTIVV